MAQVNYKANDQDLEQNAEAIPAGEYIASIIESAYELNKKGTGKILKLTHEVLDGPFKGRKVFENLNIENESTRAMEIAKRSLNAICVCTGVMELQDSSQLHGIPMVIKVNFKKDDEYGDKNEVKKHIPLDSAQPVAVTQAQQSAQQAQQVAQTQATQPPNAGVDQNNAAPAQPWVKKNLK